jgi:hypothetical protein
MLVGEVTTAFLGLMFGITWQFCGRTQLQRACGVAMVLLSAYMLFTVGGRP